MNTKLLNTLAYVMHLQDLNSQELSQFVGGLYEGLIGGVYYSDIATCLTNSSQVESNLSPAVEHLKFRDYNDVMQGIHYFSNILLELPSNLSKCASMQGDIATVTSWGQLFNDFDAHTSEYLRNLVQHYPYILSVLDIMGGQVS